ncbi:MAG: putative DNA-binding domain-containing protein [Candidatus Obscuribacterales bacterium]|nr:putative DNA-binding domain-containing protein [Candidatus Obscuribacterales bacterium]
MEVPSNLPSKPNVQPDLKIFQQQLVKLFTSEREREHFLQSTSTEYATFQSIQLLPKAPVVIYADLLKTAADGVMSSIFPAVRTYFEEDQWTHLIEDYLQAYPPSHYRLNFIAQNFSQYLGQLTVEEPWLAEIADYEYQELAVEESIEPSANGSFTPLLSQTDIMTLCPLLNQTLCHRRYPFDVVEAVDAILNDTLLPVPPIKKPTIVVFFRDPETHRCRQLKLGRVAESVLLATLEDKHTYAEILGKCLAIESNAKIEDRLAELLGIVNDFHEADLFTGNFKCASGGS